MRDFDKAELEFLLLVMLTVPPMAYYLVRTILIVLSD